MVALYHFRATLSHPVNSHVLMPAVVQHAYLFVDFFFVLSGFVIATSYEERLIHARIGIQDFLRLRFARIYPMHLLSMLAMLGLIVLFRHSTTTMSVAVPPVDVRLETWLANIFLLQGLHATPSATLNHPSWSISTEFATYVLFAFLWRFAGARTWLVDAVIVILAPLALALLVGHMDTTYTWGILRSLLGFALGALLYRGLRRPAPKVWAERTTYGVASGLELVLLAAIVGFVSLPDRNLLTIAAPFLFALAVAVFSLDRGVVSTILKSRWGRHVGAISYSIYMLHWPLQMAFMYVARRASIAFGLDWLFYLDPVTHLHVLGLSKFTGDVATGVMLALLLVLSTLTYRYVETPWRARARAASAH
jgi:peptidoglycan/LPS O-acetylase OafA/YrhL